MTKKNDQRRKKLFHAYQLKDYPIVEAVEFPDKMPIAFAVCGKKCGNYGFIVDGQTQVCPYCGRQMFRTEIETYKLVEQKSSKKIKVVLRDDSNSVK